MAPSIFGFLDPPVGDSISGIFRILEKIDMKLFSCVREPDASAAILAGAEFSLGRFSIYDVEVVDRGDILLLSLTPESWWKQLPEKSNVLSPHVIDLCAGMGAMSVGPQFLGSTPMLAVDWNGLAVEHLNANYPGTILHLDLSSRDAARKIHEACSHPPGLVMMGFPCQPHSFQGSQLGCQDARAQVLWHGLHIIFMVQPQAAILECTPAAGTNDEVQRALESLASAMQWDLLSVDLDLQAVWPCKRHRWWALLLPSTWNKIGMPQWNFSTPFDCIGSILHDWGSWGVDDETQLQLSPLEVDMYHDVRYGSDVRQLELHHIAATMLHSYANALSACPCGCRSRGFHPLTLQKGGLRGYYVLSKKTGMPRFLHPREAGLLLGLPDSITYPHDARASLSLLGLVASPLQSLWVYGHLKRNHWLATSPQPCPAVEDWLWAYCQELLCQALPTFGAPVSSLELDLTSFGAPLGLRLHHSSSTVLQLLQAERISLAWNEGGDLWQDAVRLPFAESLQLHCGHSLHLQCHAGPPNRLKPDQPIVIAIHHGDFHQAHIVQPGCFLFELLAEMGLPLVRRAITLQGRILMADQRLWAPTMLWTLQEAPWHLPCGHFRTAAGDNLDSFLGLHDGHVWQGMQQLLQHSSQHGSCLALHPAIAAAVLHGWISPAHQAHLREVFAASNGTIFCIFEAHGHWTLLHGSLQSGYLHWAHYDGLFDFVSFSATRLAACISGLLGLDFCPPQHHCVTTQLDSTTCGTVALVHLGHLLNPGFTVQAMQVRFLHSWILARFGASGSIFATGLSTLSVDQMDKLIGLLTEHGVPAHKASERAQQVLSKLGAPAIIASFVAKNNWAHLKMQANKPGVALRLVLPDELSHHAEQKAIQKYGAGISNHKRKKKQEKVNPPTPHLDPTALLLQPGHFKDEDGDDVPQLTFEDIQAEAHGIAIATVAQSQHWLQQSASISTSALALLVTEELPSDLMHQHGISKVSFTATYKGTGEPVLIFGCLKNLGDHKINRHLPGNLSQVDIVDNAVVRFHVYRDELSVAWTELVQSPVRVLCNLVPLLQLCPGDGCGPDCPKSHAAVGESLDSVIMEVWARSFGKIEGGRAPAPEASYFSVFMRIPESTLRPLLQQSIPGIYIDPRKDKSADERFRIVWLSAHTLADALYSCKKCVQALGLVRLRHKYGIRVDAADEEIVFKQLKPEATFIATRVQRTFQIFPLPHGLQRAGVVKILGDLKWLAKPLQPGRGHQDGISWQVGSSVPPPTSTFTSFGKEVLITETTKPATTSKPPSFLASVKTQQHLRSEASSSTSAPATGDPWQEKANDPWNTWHPTTSHAAPKVASGKSHLAEMTGQLRDELQATVRKELDHFKSNQDATMAAATDEATENRFLQIESTMGEIQAQQVQFNEWFSQIGKASTATENAIQTINYTLSTHQQEMQGLHHEVKSVSDNLGHTLQKTLSNHQSEMAADFSARFDKLEAMFAKKQRSE
eukprot:s241_g23.t1